MTNQEKRKINKMYPKKLKRRNISWWKRIFNHFVSCASICSIHGFNHIARRNISPYERLLWFLLVASATAWCIELALSAWNRYQTRPTVISLERDHWKWNTTFPAVTLCLDTIDDSKAIKLMSELNISEKIEFKEFLIALATANIAAYEDFYKYENESLYEQTENYLNWVLRTSLTLKDPVEISQTFGELLEFETILSEFGICFTYNSKIAIYSTPEYWAKRTNKLIYGNNTTIMINPTIAAPTLSIRSLSSGYKIFFHGPNEIPEMSTKDMPVVMATFANFELSIRSAWTPSEVRSLKIEQRKCRLTHESNLKYSPVYSYNLCRSECRRNLIYKLCKCVPFYYRPSRDHEICNIVGMQCLYKNKDKIKYLNGETCDCIPPCDIDIVTISKHEITDWFLGTNIQWKVVYYPTVRYKHSLIFSSTSVLVQIGGVAGLLLGCSVLSLIEILYFFTLRFYWGVVRGRTI